MSRLLPRIALAAGGAAVYVALVAGGLGGQSATFDEVAYVPAGYTHLTRGDYRVFSEHPPLVKALSALPLLAMDVTMKDDDPAWARRRPFEFGRRFLFEWNDAGRIIFRARLMMVGVTVGLLLTLVFWSWNRWGPEVGAITSWLAALSPNLLAHGPLVTTDVPITFVMLAAVLHWRRLLGDATAARVLLGGLLLGAALATKFSGVLLLPVLGLLGLAAALSSMPMAITWRGRTEVLRGRGRRLALVAVLLVLVGLVTIPVIWAAYGFNVTVTPDPAVNEAFALDKDAPDNPLILRSALLAQRLRLLPDGFLFGFLRFLHHAGSRRAFLFGELSDEGWWWYFPATVALKEPLPLLGLLAAAVFFAARGAGRTIDDAFLCIPPAVYVTVAVTGNLNIGHRHLMPALPFVLVIAARAAARLWRSGRPALRAAVVLLLAGYGTSVVRVHPHYLAYFNEIVGPRNGWRYLSDSNVDWGQDLPALKRYLDEHGITRVKLSYFGAAEPGYYGIAYDRLPGHGIAGDADAGVSPGDWVAVSATNLQAVYLTDDPAARRLMRRLLRQEPVAQLGYSIFIYRADFAWRPR